MVQEDLGLGLLTLLGGTTLLLGGRVREVEVGAVVLARRRRSLRSFSREIMPRRMTGETLLRRMKKVRTNLCILLLLSHRVSFLSWLLLCWQELVLQSLML